MFAVALALLLAVPVIATSTLSEDAGTAPDRSTERVMPPNGVAAGVRQAPTSRGPVHPLSAVQPRRGLAPAAVAAAEAEAAAPPAIELGIAVLDRTTGELAVGSRGAEPFYTASLAKLVVAVDMLDRRRFDGLVIDESALDLLHRALGPSDDSAMNALWTRFDGVGAPARVSARLGLSDTIAPSDPSQWGEMSVSPSDMVKIYDYVLDQMPEPDRTLLMDALAAAPDIARDGFDQAFGLLAHEVDQNGTAVTKQGWMCCFSGQYYLHSAGTVDRDRRFVVALMSRIPRSSGWASARAELTAVARVTVQALG